MCVQIFPPFSKTIFVIWQIHIVLFSVFHSTVPWMITVVPNVFRMYLTVGRGSPCTMQVKWASLPNPEWTFSASTSISGSSEMWKETKIQNLLLHYKWITKYRQKIPKFKLLFFLLFCVWPSKKAVIDKRIILVHTTTIF